MATKKGSKKAAQIMSEGNSKANGGKTVRPTQFSHKFTESDIPTIIDGLSKYHPLIAIANKLDCSYSGLQKFIHSTPVLEEAFNRTKEGMKDIAVSRLYESINMGNLNAIIYYLNTQARDRGFGEHHTIDENINDKTPARRIVIGNVSADMVAKMKAKCAAATEAAHVKESPIAKEDGGEAQG